MKTFCPNCEKETECEFTAELYECEECGEDFAKYVVGRKAQDEKTQEDALFAQLKIEQLQPRIDELEAYADKLAQGLPEGMLPKDVELLREANQKLAQRVFELEEALKQITFQFFSDGADGVTAVKMLNIAEKALHMEDK